ncbi:MAG: DUF1844 domain-containing protein [Acidobacteriota bacterium]|nr:DUF1844 domain-containing protein [Acidobacteriota bacterium]MDH3786783.1 DUF1844 domain-containing protein [Acidobacteriota bacterium]
MADRERTRGSENQEAGSEIKVTDRRLFTPDGKLREALEESEEESSSKPSGEDSSEPVEASETDTPGFEHRSLDEPEGVDFTMLINAMAQPALIFLGEIPYPGSGKPEVNLEQAALQIDLLDLLRIRCRGNLSPQEEGLLERMLYQLRMLFVARKGTPSPDSEP